MAFSYPVPLERNALDLPILGKKKEDPIFFLIVKYLFVD